MAQLQFNDTTNKLGVIQSCEAICNLGDAGITGDTQLLKEFTRYINKAGSSIWTWIFSSYGGAQYDDAGQGDLPSATDELTINKTKYALPSGAITIRGVEVKNQGGVWEQLLPINDEQIQQMSSIGEFMKTSGQPRFYKWVGETIFSLPASNYTQAASWKVFFDRGSVAFASSDTTKTPGFSSEFHDALPIGASIEWYKIHKPDSNTLQELKVEWKEWENKIRDFYMTRYWQMFPPRIKERDATQEFS